MIELRPGDVFCTTSVGAGADWKSRLLCSSIRKIEKTQSSDGQAFYTHAGFITAKNGTTFEARWKYGFYHMDDYCGGAVLIGRPKVIPAFDLWPHQSEAYGRGWAAVARYRGRNYPLWRLLMFMAPGLPSISITKLPVCSELVCMFLIAAGVTEIGKWKGRNPDDVADMIKKWHAFDVIYEGDNWPDLPAKGVRK